MNNLNIEFLEQYKNLDKLCKDMLNSSEGISSYILEMENTPYEFTLNVPSWDNTYQKLKHLRWMRNQLVHEKSFEEDFCSEEDLKSINYLYDLILNVKDPLSLVPNTHTNENYSKNTSTDGKPDFKAIIDKVVSKIKSFFS
ncbi:MAG: hypothetical protein K2M75_02100 [Clostridia bacterium]|nr:hypothetical protein [Clostridia bacterium]